jgi:hypothetical protein
MSKEKRRKRLDAISKHNQRLQIMLQLSSDHSLEPALRRNIIASAPVAHLGIRQKITRLPKIIARLWCKYTQSGHEIFVGLFKPLQEHHPVLLDMLVNLSCSTDIDRYWGESRVCLDLDEYVNSIIACFFESDSCSSEWKSLVESSDGENFPHYPNKPKSNSPPGSLSGMTLSQSPISTSPMHTAFGSHNEVSMGHSKHSVEDWKRHNRSKTSSAQVAVLCEHLKTNTRRRLCSELILKENTLLQSEPKSRYSIETSHREYPLEKFFTTPNSSTFTLKNRKFLQVIIARSLIFYPWDENHTISKHSLYIMGDQPLDLLKPFAPLQLYREARDTEKRDSGVGYDELEELEYSVSPNETLASFATLLLELELNKSIESLRSEADLDMDGFPTVNSNYFTAMRYLEENRDNLYPQIYEVIDACLTCDFETDEYSLENAEFLEKVYERIVVPLETQLEIAFPQQLKAVEAQIEASRGTIKRQLSKTRSEGNSQLQSSTQQGENVMAVQSNTVLELRTNATSNMMSKIGLEAKNLVEFQMLSQSPTLVDRRDSVGSGIKSPATVSQDSTLTLIGQSEIFLKEPTEIKLEATIRQIGTVLEEVVS